MSPTGFGIGRGELTGELALGWEECESGLRPLDPEHAARIETVSAKEKARLTRRGYGLLSFDRQE